MRRERNESSSRGGAWLLPLTLAGLGGLGWACQDVGGEADSGTVDELDQGENTRADVLASIADQVVVPASEAFVEDARRLTIAVDELAASGTEEARLAAQQAWIDAMTSWQALELMQVGPSASSLAGIGGEDLRDEIYSWPTVDTCSVDRVLVDEGFAQADFFATQLVWAYGLDALEYLLFVGDPAHSCPSQVQLDGPWAALSPEEVDQRRARYAAVVAAGIEERAVALADRWSPQGGDFAAALAHPGEGESPYEDQVEALDEVFRAMFYVDKQTKDGKLGVPLGLVEGCSAVPCVDMMEMPWSGQSTAAIAANLRALRTMVQGGEDPETAIGFDDLLYKVGEGAIADDLLGRIDGAIAVAEGLPASMQEAVATDPEGAQALYDSLKGVTDTLKGPFVMALMLTIPAEGAGDND